MRVANGHVGQEPWLVAFRTSSGATKPAESKPMVEFIVRTEDGTTLSIVQANDTDFRLGDRVVILRTNETRLAPSG